MALRWDARKVLDGKMTEYMEYVEAIYPGKSSVVVGVNNVRKRYKSNKGLGLAIIKKMEKLGLAEQFTESERNSAYELDLRKIRRYLKGAKGKE